MKNFPTGIKDLDREILSKLPDDDVIKSCSVNSYLRDKVCDEGFFERRMKENYPEFEIIIDDAYPNGTYSGNIYPNYKQAYLKTVYYISKMKEIGYDYVRSRLPPKIQYHRAKEVYDIVSELKLDESSFVISNILRYVIEMEDLNLIKYAMKLYNFKILRQRAALNDSGTLNLDIIKYFAEQRSASSMMIERALAKARKKGDVEMIKYFENILNL